MNQALFQSLCIPGSLSLLTAHARMDAAACGVLLVVDVRQQLLRTVTDGDLRRARLAQMSDDDRVDALPMQPPKTVAESAGVADILQLMNQHQIDHVPVLDGAGRVIDVVLLRELGERIWLSSPHLGHEESAFVADAFRTNWIAPLGPHVDGFETELAAQVGVAHAAALSSGTAALHLGLLLLGVQRGDVVFCSTLTFVGSCNPILYCGAEPVFIDAEPASWNMSPQALERGLAQAAAVGRLPRCVIIVNLYGQSADMEALLPICRRYGVPVLEDAAESLGASYQGRPSGSFGDLGVYSFNGNKIITTSGGGMLVSDNGDLIAQARKLSTQARDVARHYQHSEMGFNYRMSNVLAGIGRGQLKVLAQRVEQRRAVYARYREALSDIPAIQWMPEPASCYSSRWLSCFELQTDDAASDVLRLMQALERHAVEARPVWKPMHLQPLFANALFVPHQPGEDVAGRLFRGGLCLPSGSNLSLDHQQQVIDHLRQALAAL